MSWSSSARALTVWLVSVAYLPFCFRSGLARGTWLFVAFSAVAIVGAALLARALALASVSPALGPALTGIAALVVAVGLGWLSLRLSIRFYEARDL